MAANNGLVFMEGFDNILTADLPGEWNSFSGTTTVSAGNGRNSTASLRINSAAGGSISITLTATAKKLAGFAYKRSGLPGAASTLCRFVDVSTTQVDLRLNTDGTLTVTRNGTTLGTSTFALSSGTFYYVEFMALIDPSAGTYEVRVNGVNRLSGTGANTRSTANSTANVVVICDTNTTGSTNADFDDIYICEGSNSAFLGDVKVVTVRPDSAGNYSQFTPSAGANYTCVDETTPNGDTDYVETVTLNAIDSYNFGALGVVGTVFGVMENLRVRNTDATATNFVAMARIGGVDYLGSKTNAPGTSYASYFQLWENSPATATNWTISEIDGAEWGIKKTL